MAFQSLGFAALLLLCAAFYFTVPKRARLWVLLAANCIFFLEADPSAGVWLAVCVMTTWLAGLLLDGTECAAKRRALLAACLAVNLGLLVFFKYVPVWLELSGAEFTVPAAAKSGGNRWFSWAAPLGISFYTLEAAGYLLDIYARKYPAEKSPARYAVFLSFFPNISSGPIERGGDFLTQLDRVLRLERRALFNYDRIMEGAAGILWGFFMKMVVADRVAVLVNTQFADYRNANSFTMLTAALFYAVQIYCDFASYSAIAAGLARILGIELTRNFRQPYFAVNISDFWRRWHISLSGWLRDYVYIPLGGNRKGRLRKYLNLILVFLISGLWHGGAPVFLVWGLAHGVCLAAEDIYKQHVRGPGGRKTSRGRALRRAAARMFTFFTVTCLWIIFRSENLEMAGGCLKALFMEWEGFFRARELLFSMGLGRAELLVVFAGIAILFITDLISERKGEEPAVWIYHSPIPARWGICLFLLAAVFVFGKYGGGFHAESFIYVKF